MKFKCIYLKDNGTFIVYFKHRIQVSFFFLFVRTKKVEDILISYLMNCVVYLHFIENPRKFLIFYKWFLFILSLHKSNLKTFEYRQIKTLSWNSNLKYLYFLFEPKMIFLHWTCLQLFHKRERNRWARQEIRSGLFVTYEYYI